MSAARHASLPTAAPAGIRPSTAYLSEIECLRGVAILLVFLFHLDGYLRGLAHRDGTIVSPAFAFIGGGHTGVSLFFVLSAFLLSMPFLVEARGGKPVERRRYLMRRALRILPLYWAAVVVGTALWAKRAVDLLRGVPYLFFLNAVPTLTVPLEPYGNVWWSLATEVQFYLVLPLLPVLLRSGRGRWLTGVLLVVWALAYALFLSGWGLPYPYRLYVSLSLFGRLPLFALGILAAVLYLAHGERLRARWAATPWLRNGGADLLFLAVLAALGFVLRAVIRVGYMVAETSALHVWHIVEGALWAVVVLLLLLAPLRTKPLVHNRAFALLGVLSYSIYILHFPLATWAFWTLRTRAHPLVGWSVETAAFVGALGLVCTLLSGATYRLIERPFLVRKARLDQ